MFIGHALLAFALAVLLAEWRGWSAERALAVGVAAGAFAALPDVDVFYAVVAMNPTELVAGTSVQPGAFWGTASDAHRLMTHSLVVAVLAGAGFGLWTLRAGADGKLLTTDRQRLSAVVLALLTLVTLVVVTGLASGPIGAFVMAAFVVFGLGIAELSRSYLGLRPRIIGLAAVAGIASHPWGDLVTGEPPVLLYPFEIPILTERIVLSSDPTLHLLGAFAIELAVIALAAVVVARHLGFRPRELVDRRALIGSIYGVGAVVMAPPTIHLSYDFVFSILAVGGFCGTIHRSPRGWYPLRQFAHRLAGNTENALRTVFTMLAGIAIALLSYGVVYLLVG